MLAGLGILWACLYWHARPEVHGVSEIKVEV